MASMRLSRLLPKLHLTRSCRPSCISRAPSVRTTAFFVRHQYSTTTAPPDLKKHAKEPTPTIETEPPKKQVVVKYTAEKYPELRRDPRFKKLTSEDVAYFKSVLPSSSILSLSESGTSATDLDPYNTDWMRKYRGQSTLILRPTSTTQVSSILKYCNEHSIAVVPQGGNTGLVGGSVPVFDEVVISLDKMNKVRGWDDVSGIVVCDAGIVLEVLDNYVRERGHIVPLDLGAKGSCQIGGNVATNAGGLRLLRYGSLHGTVLGLEVVLPDGTVLDNLSMLRKDNTGYDIKQLFIGSEGTLGVITGVSIVTPQAPKAVNVAMLGVNSFEEVQKVFSRAKADLGEILSAFEFWDSHAFGLVNEHLPWLRNPLSDIYPFQVLIETSGSKKDHDDEKLNGFLEEMMGEEVVVDGAVAQDNAQIASMWSIRESIPEACSKAGSVYKYDISIPVPQLYNLVQDTRNRLENAGVLGDGEGKVSSVIGYGHLGDGNLHLNIAAGGYTKEVTDLIEPFVYEWAAKQNGSISAEHGLGLMKAQHLHYSKSSSMITAMQKIKELFDPKGIMNPYKFLPSRE
ncbi:actin interacting protein 2 [Paraphysoderma sedebokerense]|nr:actin interacting protein 2 [Paraphysoderma sedebokerense]